MTAIRCLKDSQLLTSTIATTVSWIDIESEAEELRPFLRGLVDGLQERSLESVEKILIVSRGPKRFKAIQNLLDNYKL